MSDAKTSIRFDKVHSLTVSETPEQVENAIAAAANPHLPIAVLHRTDGREVRVNATTIRTISPYGRGS